MFDDYISSTVFTTGYANTVFSRINGSTYGMDNTLVSTLRALVFPRMPETDTLDVVVKRRSISGVAERDGERLFDHISDYLEPNTFILCEASGCSQQIAEAAIEAAKSCLFKYRTDYFELEKVSAFFKKSFPVRCLVNIDTKTTLLFTGELDYRKWHFLQCGLLAFFPWYFRPEDGVSPDEMDLIRSLSEKTPDAYKLALKRLIANYNLRDESIRSSLSTFESDLERKKQKETENKILRIDARIKELRENLASYIAERRNYESIIAGYEAKISAASDGGIMEYFLCSKALVLEDVDSERIKFGTVGYLTYFDKTAAEKYLRNEGSFFYNPGDGTRYDVDASDIKLLMEAVFVSQKIRMRMCAKYALYINGSSCDGLRNEDYDAPEYDGYSPNVHVDKYSCLGDFNQIIPEMLMNCDYISAVEECITSCVSLNVHDIAVMRETVKRIFDVGSAHNDPRCFELPSGEVVRAKEAIEYLKGAEQNGEETQAQ